LPLRIFLGISLLVIALKLPQSVTHGLSYLSSDSALYQFAPSSLHVESGCQRDLPEGLIAQQPLALTLTNLFMRVIFYF
jgi:hypothetical protein